MAGSVTTRVIGLGAAGSAIGVERLTPSLSSNWICNGTLMVAALYAPNVCPRSALTVIRGHSGRSKVKFLRSASSP